MIPMTSAFGAKFSHRRCFLFPTPLGLLRFSLDLLAARRANRLAIVLSLTIGFEALEPVGVDGFLGKVCQLGEEFMSALASTCLPSCSLGGR